MSRYGSGIGPEEGGAVYRWLVPLVFGPLLSVFALIWLVAAVGPWSPDLRAPTFLDFGRRPERLDMRRSVEGGGLPAQEVRTGAAVNDPLFTRRELAPPLHADILFPSVTVLDATHFRVASAKGMLTIRIAGIVGPKFADLCGVADGVPWRCGAQARGELARLIGRRSVGCNGLVEDGDGQKAGDCFADGHDLAGWLVERGWADPESPDDARLAALSSIAIAEQRGRYQGTPDDRAMNPNADAGAADAATP